MEGDTKSKILFLSVILCLIVAINYSVSSNQTTTKPSEPQVIASRYTYGLLKQKATWADEFDDVYHMTALKETSRVHYNYKSTKIEIWNLDIVTADGQRNKNIVMIYFLEGKYQGRWGYTLRAYTEI